MNCKLCGQPFPDIKNKRYCSVECRNRAESERRKKARIIKKAEKNKKSNFEMIREINNKALSNSISYGELELNNYMQSEEYKSIFELRRG